MAGRPPAVISVAEVRAQLAQLEAGASRAWAFEFVRQHPAWEAEFGWLLSQAGVPSEVIEARLARGGLGSLLVFFKLCLAVACPTPDPAEEPVSVQAATEVTPEPAPVPAAPAPKIVSWTECEAVILQLTSTTNIKSAYRQLILTHQSITAAARWLKAKELPASLAEVIGQIYLAIGLELEAKRRVADQAQTPTRPTWRDKVRGIARHKCWDADSEADLKAMVSGYLDLSQGNREDFRKVILEACTESGIKPFTDEELDLVERFGR